MTPPHPSVVFFLAVFQAICQFLINIFLAARVRLLERAMKTLEKTK